MKSIALCALLTPVIAGGGLALWPQAPGTTSSLPSPSLTQAAVVALVAASALPSSNASGIPTAQCKAVELHTAVEQGSVMAEFHGNGRDEMRAFLKNATSAPIAVHVARGQMFEAAQDSVIVLRSGQVQLSPGKLVQVPIATAATRSANRLDEQNYEFSYGALPKLDALLAYADKHPELSTASLQTAILARMENLPLSAVSKFSSVGADLPTKFDTSAFRTETGDILQALVALRAIGLKDSQVAMTIDQQLKIEAMISPETRPTAMRYYGITPETEWEYWKTQLLSGDPATRHYALFGIARFYPDVALEMLPKWARETKTQTVYRISAIQALADTERPEALPILQKLSEDLGRDTELGRTALNSAKFLNSQLAKMSAKRVAAIGFRSTTAMSQ